MFYYFICGAWKKPMKILQWSIYQGFQSHNWEEWLFTILQNLGMSITGILQNLGTLITGLQIDGTTHLEVKKTTYGYGVRYSCLSVLYWRVEGIPILEKDTKMIITLSCRALQVNPNKPDFVHLKSISKECAIKVHTLNVGIMTLDF